MADARNRSADQIRETDTASLAVYWRLLGYLKPYWGIFTLSIEGFVIYSVSQPAMAQFMEYLLDFINEPASRLAYMPSLTILGFVRVRCWGAFLCYYFLSRVSFGVLHTLRVQMFNHMPRLPGDYFDSHSSGHLMSVITYTVNGVTTAASDALKTLVREGATVVALLVYLIYKDWLLTVLLLLVTPLIAVLVDRKSTRLNSSH